MLKKYGPLLLIVCLWSCGASSDDSNVVLPKDSLYSSVKVQFNPEKSTLTVLETATDLESEIFEACTLSMSPIKGELSYRLEDERTLKLDSTTFEYKRPLSSPKTKAGVADRVFSVWGRPDVISDGITRSIEMELEPELLTFRLRCTG